MENLQNNKILNNISWQFIERIINYGLQFILLIVLARFLNPEEFGIAAIVNSVVIITTIFTSSGLGSSIINKNEISDLENSSIYYFTLVIGLLLFIIIFFSSPLIGQFYNSNSIVIYIQTLSPVIIFNSLNGILRAHLIKKENFKLLFILNSTPLIISFFISIILAKYNFGVYALIFNTLASSFISFFLLSINLGIPKFYFSKLKLKSHLSYGSKILIADILEIIYNNASILLIGKYFNPNLLGLYNNAKQYPNLISSIGNSTIATVTFPLFSKNKKNYNFLFNKITDITKQSNYILILGYSILYVFSDYIIKILFNENWEGAIPYLKLLTFSFVFSQIQSLTSTLLKSTEKLNTFIIIELSKKAITLSILYFTMFASIDIVIYGQILSALISLLISIGILKLIYNFDISNIIQDLMPFIIYLFVIIFVSEFTHIDYGMNDFLIRSIIIIISFKLLLHFTNFKLKL